MLCGLRLASQPARPSLHLCPRPCTRRNIFASFARQGEESPDPAPGEVVGFEAGPFDPNYKPPPNPLAPVANTEEVPTEGGSGQELRIRTFPQWLKSVGTDYKHAEPRRWLGGHQVVCFASFPDLNRQLSALGKAFFHEPVLPPSSAHSRRPKNEDV